MHQISNVLVVTICQRTLKGALYPEMPEFHFLISRYFYNLNLKYVHIKKKKLKKKLKNPQGWCTTPPNVPKLGVSGLKDTAKTNKDLGMSCLHTGRI